MLTKINDVEFFYCRTLVLNFNSGGRVWIIGSVALLLYFAKCKNRKYENKKCENFFIAFLDDLGNFKHFEPYLFVCTFYFRAFNFYTLKVRK